MNDQLLKKIITANNVPCPEFVFENPLLDRDVAEALSKSFVRVLNLTQENPQTSSLRLPILENIRNLCQTQPQNHVNIDENAATLLSEIYINKIKDSEGNNINNIEKDLDAFLIRNLKEMDVNSRYKPPLNPEIVQAFKNLNHSSVNHETLFKDIIHWNSTDNKNIRVLKDLWTDDNPMTEDISLKLKPELEQILLEICHTLLNGTVANVEDILTSNSSVQNIINKSSNSANCFQICCSILHYIFVKTNFNKLIQIFIQKFVEQVKNTCSQVTFSVLYPTHLMHIVVLLDIQLEIFNETPIQNGYIEGALLYLRKLHAESENDFIMLLSHFPQWHDIYFKNI